MSSVDLDTMGSGTGRRTAEVRGGDGEASPAGGDDAGRMTRAGAGWLASATARPWETLALWDARPRSPLVVPCGTAFDLVNAPALFGRRMVDRLWAQGPGCGPLAVRRDRVLIFAAPGTGDRLLSLLRWEEWGGRHRYAVPPLLCHGAGDVVTLPAARPSPDAGQETRWLVAPDSAAPWLPGPEVLVWAASRAARSGVRISIFPPADQGANVYDVSRRR